MTALRLHLRALLHSLLLACACLPLALLHAQSGKKTSPLAMAHKLHEEGNYSKSLPLLRKLVQESPGNYEASLLLGDELLRTGERKQAIESLLLTASLRPHENQPLLLLAEAATRSNNFSLAADVLQKALVNQPDRDEELLAWADFSLDRSREIGIMLRRSRPGEAVMLLVAASNRNAYDANHRALLTEAVGKDPTCAEAQSAYGLALLADGQIDAATTALQQARELGPQLSSTLELQAKLAAAEDRSGDAAELLHQLHIRSRSNYLRILQSWPTFLPAPAQERELPPAALPINLPAQTLFAQQAWDALQQIKPATPEQQLWQAMAQAASGNCHHAMAPLEDGLALDPLHAGYWLQICYARAGSELVARLTALHHQAALLEVRGDMLRLLANDSAAAMHPYQSALALEPKTPRLLAKVADALARTENTTEAQHTAEQALALDPHATAALRLLAQLALSERDYASAIKALSRLLTLEPADDWAHVQLGKSLAQNGESEKALAQLIPELDAGYPDAKGALHALVAGTLRQLGRTEEAARYTAEAARLSHAAESSAP